MKVHLMLPEDAPKPANLLVLARDALKADLELNVILDNISKGDKFIRNSCLSALMAPLQDLKLLEYRHAVLADAMAHPDVVRALYDLCLEAEKRRKATVHWMTNYYLSSTYSGAIEYLINFTETLQKLRKPVSPASAPPGSRTCSTPSGKSCPTATWIRSRASSRS